MAHAQVVQAGFNTSSQLAILKAKIEGNIFPSHCWKTKMYTLVFTSLSAFLNYSLSICFCQTVISRSDFIKESSYKMNKKILHNSKS